jgi:hypothetical protein
MGVGKTSMALRALNPLFSRVTWWRAQNMLEMEIDGYM